MGLFAKTRLGRSHRIRLLKRAAAIGAAAATMFAGIGVANAEGYYGMPGYKYADGSIDELAPLAYKDGLPVYCVHSGILYSRGSENRGAWQTRTDLNYRIAAQMIKDYSGDRSDFNQASIAFAIHDHLDDDQGSWRAHRLHALQGANINAVAANAGRLWSAAAQHVPASAQVRNIGGLAHGFVSAEWRNSNGGYIAGIPWNIVRSDNVKIDGPSSGTTTNGPLKINWHAIRDGQAHVVVNYNRTVARRMDYAGAQPLMTSDPGGMWIPVGTEFRVSPTFHLTVSTNQNTVKGMRTGDTNPVHDTLHVKITKSAPDAQLNPISVTGNVILHFDGNPYVPATQVSKNVTIKHGGDITSPNFTPHDFGWNEPNRHGWQAGKYWFDVRVGKQGQMDGPVDTPDRQRAESYGLKELPPNNPKKTIEQSHVVSNMIDHTRITTGTGRGGYKMIIYDKFTNQGADSPTVFTSQRIRLTSRAGHSSQ